MTTRREARGQIHAHRRRSHGHYAVNDAYVRSVDQVSLTRLQRGASWRDLAERNAEAEKAGIILSWQADVVDRHIRKHTRLPLAIWKLNRWIAEGLTRREREKRKAKSRAMRDAMRRVRERSALEDA